MVDALKQLLRTLGDELHAASQECAGQFPSFFGRLLLLGSRHLVDVLFELVAEIVSGLRVKLGESVGFVVIVFVGDDWFSLRSHYLDIGSDISALHGGWVLWL